MIDGAATLNGSAWTVPVTPEGVYLSIQQDLDGETTRRFQYVTVPDVPAMSFSELLYNRGNGEGGTEPYMWRLAEGGDFPREAIDGDIGYDPSTGNVWRYTA